MNQTPDRGDPAESTATEICAQCGKALSPEDRVASGDRLFCRSCYDSLRAELTQAIETMSTDINYLNAAVGAALGGFVGAMAWWGFTALTHIAFGLVAVAIGYLVGFATVRFAGGKRSVGLQALSVTVALISYACATYLVNMTFINKALAEQGSDFRVGFPPTDLAFLGRVLSADFGIMDLVFLALVVYQAWIMPRPLALPATPAA